MSEKITINNILNRAPNYWVVGACFGGESKRDQSERFFDEGIWEEGWGLSGNNRHQEILSRINKGDYLLLKSAFANKQTAYTRLKMIGIVKAKAVSNYYSFLIDWQLKLKSQLPKDFSGVSYRKTIEVARIDTFTTYAKELIQSNK